MTDTNNTDGAALLPVTPEEYLIRKGGAYYRPNAAGYTNNIAEAGRYSLDDAVRHSHPNGPDGPRDGIDYMLAPARQSHSLPGDVGMREAIEWLREGPDQLAEDMDTAIFKERLRQSKDARGWCGQPILNIVADALAARAALTPSPCPGDGMREALAKRTSMSTVAGGGKRPHVEIRFANLADAHALTDAVLGRTPAGNDKIETSMTVQEAWAANKKLVNSPTAVEDADGLLYEPECSETEKEREAYRLGYDHAMSGFPALVGPGIDAALTPSALSGDAGEGERLEHARIALQRVRDRFTNIGNSSPLWCDMAEDMDAYAAEGLDRSKARG